MKTTIRQAFVLQLNPGQEAEYEKRHSPIWQELIDVFHAHGVHNYSIFLHPGTLQLFGYVEVESLERWAAIAKTDACQRWWSYMGDIMPANPDGSPVCDGLREVFHFD